MDCGWYYKKLLAIYREIHYYITSGMLDCINIPSGRSGCLSEERIEKLQQSVNIVFELQPRRPQMGRSPYAASWFFYMLHGFCLLKKQNCGKVGEME